jgi:hypothetical protein
MLTRLQECVWVYSLCRLCDNHVIGTPMDEACHAGNHGTRGRIAARIDFMSININGLVCRIRASRISVVQQVERDRVVGARASRS